MLTVKHPGCIMCPPKMEVALMGLFSFFKRKKLRETKEETRAESVVTIQATLTATRKQPTALLKGLDTVKPNRCGNYLFTPEPADNPTDRQLAYAKNLGLRIPKGACKTDVSALISRAEDNDEEPAAPEFLAFLAARGWRGSTLTGHDFSLKIVYNFVDNPREQLALYAYYIDRAENGLDLGNLDTAPRKDHYLAFADHALQNPKALEHYQSWRRDKTWSKAKTWGIYKDYKMYCRENV